LAVLPAMQTAFFVGTFIVCFPFELLTKFFYGDIFWKSNLKPLVFGKELYGKARFAAAQICRFGSTDKILHEIYSAIDKLAKS
jgi:hypothetical protein